MNIRLPLVIFQYAFVAGRGDEEKGGGNEGGWISLPWPVLAILEVRS
jgi:hypothetical protein